jgi:hypothetical protein
MTMHNSCTFRMYDTRYEGLCLGPMYTFCVLRGAPRFFWYIQLYLSKNKKSFLNSRKYNFFLINNVYLILYIPTSKGKSSKPPQINPFVALTGS